MSAATDVRTIRRILVANRGEIARRVFRTARAMGIGTVAVYSDPDSDALFVHEADAAVALHGTTSAETYLDSAKILAAAATTGADAIHPGYGFLAENAAFAQAVLDAGITWIGPPPDAIASMGDKLTALGIMERLGVPTLPRATVGDVPADELSATAERVGYPILVKASAGGGGKGMRIVRDAGELGEAVAAARRESAKAFSSDVVYLERYLDTARHIEIQVLADRHGEVRHLFERECSIQRRHQKIVEEAPSPFLTPELRAEMGAAAVAAARGVGYEGAGTVEFIVDPRGQYAFLEMNTRLQVEHTVTEMITGVDLVREQILVAEGHPLNLPAGMAIGGAAIEVRLYAEDPANEFLPASGRLVRWQEPSGIRVESGVTTGDIVSVHYDPMLAKLVAHAPTRREAARILSHALREMRVHGPATNRQFLATILDHPAFLAGETTTDFIERCRPHTTTDDDPGSARRAAIAAVVAAREVRRDDEPAEIDVPPGWRNLRHGGEITEFGAVSVEIWERRDGTLTGRAGGEPFEARLHGWDDPWLDIEIDGQRERLTVTFDRPPAGAHDRVWVQSATSEVSLIELPRFPSSAPPVASGSLTAPMNGTVIDVLVAPGVAVVSGQTLVVVEAMKMEHKVVAPSDGTVAEVLVSLGDTVAQDQVLIVVDDGSS